MTKIEYVKSLVKESYNKYNIEISFDKLPWSGDIIDTKLNDGTTIKVDRLVEFSLCALYSYYFIDRYCYAFDPIKGAVPFKLFDFQKEALEEIQNNKKVIFRKCRQTGISILTGAYALWRANFHKAQFIKIISLTRDDAVEFKEKSIDINYYSLPGFLKTKSTRDGYSKTKLKLVNQSYIKVLPKSKNAGRGGTPSLIIIDEAAFNEWMDNIWKAIEPSLDKGGDLIVISTTNGVGNWYHLTYTRAEDHTNEFYPIFIPWWKYPDRDNPWLNDILSGKIPKNEIESFVKEKELEALSYKGDIKKAPWLYKKRANAKTEKDFQQEILADFLGSGETVITSKSILDISKNVRDPKWIDTLPTNIISQSIPGLWCWKKVEKDHLYILTSDTATGHGKDFSTFHVIDFYEKEQAAEYKNQIPTDKFGEIIKKVARYYNQAYVIIETNNPGPAVFNEVYKSKIDPYYNVYVVRKGKDLVSWETTKKSRVLLIEDFFRDIENGYTKIYSKRLVEEIKVFIWNEKGKAEALSGYNDDLVIAYAIYAHMKDKVFNSAPIGISSSKTSSFSIKEELNDLNWSRKEDKIEDILGIDLTTYYWLMGKEVPNEYIKFKNKEEFNIESPPDWLRKRIQNRT